MLELLMSFMEEEQNLELILGKIKEILLPLGCALLITLIATILFIHFSSRKQHEGKNVWKWIGVSIIMCIPLVSIIMLFVWAYGNKTREDPTFRGWARYTLTIILFVVVFILATIGMITLFKTLGIQSNFLLFN